jgi:hypothetical protein
MLSGPEELPFERVPAYSFPMEPFNGQDPEVSPTAERSWWEANPVPALLLLIEKRPDDWDLDLL